MTKPKVEKLDKEKAKSETPTISTDSDNLSWIPVSTGGLDYKEKKTGRQLTATLELKYISTKLDKFSRSVSYFSCVNPQELHVVKDDMETQGLNPEATTLPFWQGLEGDVMLRVSRQNCSITEDELISDGSTLTRTVEFKQYSGKKNGGYSIHM